MPSFDVVSEVDKHELTNAIDQANRELSTRFDFKGVDAKFEQDGEKLIKLAAPSDFQLKQMADILKQRLAARGIDFRCMEFGDIETNLGGARQQVTVKQGIEQKLAKQIAAKIKESKIKVDTQINGDKLRVNGKKRDDLQEVIALLKKTEFEQPLLRRFWPPPRPASPRMAAPLPSPPAMNDTAHDPIADTRRWLEKAVIGLNLCPFAKAVYVKEQVRFVLSDATTPEALLEQLAEELLLLRDTPAEQVDTTLIVHPQVLADFLDYNDFLDNADAAVEALDLQGILQVASFHPQYQFAGAAPDDVSNYTNRAPWPTLHLLREDSVERAVAAFPDPDVIVERNIATLDRLGIEGWNRLLGGE